MAQQNNPEFIVILGPVRFSYLNVFAPRLNQSKTPPVMEYDTMLLIPKEANEVCPDPIKVRDKVMEAIKACGIAKFGAAAKGWRQPLKDGDVLVDGEAPHAGYWTMRVAAKVDYQPILIDGDKNPVTGGWVSGDWGMVKLKLWTYDMPQNKGVSGGLRAIQFLYKDTPLGSPHSVDAVANEFDSVPGAHKVSTQDADEYDPFKDGQ